MKTFEHFNKTGAPCPICGTHEDKPPVLIGLDGTEHDGIMEGLQIHLECIDLTAYRKGGRLLLSMVCDEKKPAQVHNHGHC